MLLGRVDVESNAVDYLLGWAGLDVAIGLNSAAGRAGSGRGGVVSRVGLASSECRGNIRRLCAKSCHFDSRGVGAVGISNDCICAGGGKSGLDVRGVLLGGRLCAI